jgi:hypothetical protein
VFKINKNISKIKQETNEEIAIKSVLLSIKEIRAKMLIAEEAQQKSEIKLIKNLCNK